MPEPPFDLAKAHRWFAIELNNLAWDLLENESRSAEDAERMVHAAHASVHHWLQVGTALNHQRGQCLLATAYAAAQLPEAAVRHAERCLALSRQNGAEQTPFDLATAYGSAAQAYAAMGNQAKAQALYSKSREYVAALDSADQAVFSKLYAEP
jgi:hypothetical protein